MPGIVVFGRRWSAGSDDMVVPSILLVCMHVVWLIALSAIFANVEFDLTWKCSEELKDLVLGYIVIIGVCLVVESVIVWVSLRGGILDTEPRSSMQYLLYARLVIFLGEIAWIVISLKWIVNHYTSCSPDAARKIILGVTIFTCCMILIFFISLWCTFDTAGRKWVKMKRYQESMKEKTRRARRSGSARRNWRQRKAFRAYEESWDRRLGLMCCCVERKGRNKNSMSEIAQLFTEFFRDLDVVPSDVIAGLVLLRRYQKLHSQHTIGQGSNDVYRYLSGVPVTPRTQFLQLGQPEVLQQFKMAIHYMKFAMAAYGWPIFMMMNTGTGLCKMIPYLRCCCCKPCCSSSPGPDVVIDDNCCECNLVALKRVSGLPDTDLVYVTYHVDIGETPFYVALDHKNKKIVICVRGTLSLQDVLTDLKADPETVPVDPIQEDWTAHKGMVQAALYIKKKLKTDGILERAFEKCKETTNETYELVLVGHSLGAGTATILAILLQQEYQELHCYAYAPPGGLLSFECMEATKSFITSVVVGKDVVPSEQLLDIHALSDPEGGIEQQTFNPLYAGLGLHQMELLRTDLISLIKKSKYPKWKIISRALCCGTESAAQMTYNDVKEDVERHANVHPTDEQIGLTAYKPMFPPGKIILVVRSHPGGKKVCCGAVEPVYQAIWADNSDFQELLISPTMVNDHMPDNVMEALEKVLVNVAPPKPTRLLSETERKALLNHDVSPETPILQPSSQSYLMAETTPSVRIIDSNNTQNNDVHVKLTEATDLRNFNSCGWDAATEEILLSLDRQHLFPGLGEPPRLEFDLGSDWIQAPLASPEILSTSSSVSALSRSNSLAKAEQKAETIASKLETIQQSPDMKIKIDTPTAGSLEQVCDTAGKPGSAGDQLATTPSSESLKDLWLKPQPFRNLNNGELSTDLSKGSMNNLLKNSEFRNSQDVLAHNSLLADPRSALLHNSVSECVISGMPGALDTVDSTVRLPIPVDLTKTQQDAQKDSSEESYERHSPDESTQYGYGNMNELYSAAGIGYQPQHYVKPSTKAKPPHPNKRLHYSQSESYLQVLSEEYKMKRSTEERDIAHLGDKSPVFTAAEKKRPVLIHRDSAPAIDKTLGFGNGIERLDSVLESDAVSPLQDSGNMADISEDMDHDTAALIVGDIKHKGKKKQPPDTSWTEVEGEYYDNVDDDQQRLLSDKTLVSSSCKDDPNSNHYTDSAISPTSKETFDNSEPRLFNSNSYSTSASSFSGESDKHLSSVSGQSDEAELPITETDV